MAVDTQSEERNSEAKERICSGDAEAGGLPNLEGALTDREVLCALLSTMQHSSRNWQLVVFPSLFAFILLAGYGFYLIYNLVEDVDKMANSVYLNLGFVAERMTQISLNLDALTGSMQGHLGQSRRPDRDGYRHERDGRDHFRPHGNPAANATRPSATWICASCRWTPASNRWTPALAR